jgi:hypothetical protein
MRLSKGRPVSPTREQSLAALARADEIRLGRASLKREIAALPQHDGERRVAELLLDPPEVVVSAEVDAVLCWTRGWGSRRVRRFLVANRVAEMKPVGSLTERQRRMLANQLRGIARAANGNSMPRNPNEGGSMGTEEGQDRSGQQHGDGDNDQSSTQADRVEGDQVAGDKVEQGGSEADQRSGVVPDRK